jgi:hypothetical protein
MVDVLQDGILLQSFMGDKLISIEKATSFIIKQI